MWFRKKAENPALVECVGCGCLMRTARKVVEVREEEGFFTVHWLGSEYTEPEPSSESYCGRCAPSYDVREWGGPKPRYFRTEPNVEVTEKGKTVKGGE